MDHLDRVKQEFTRQAEPFAASAAITDDRITARFVAALGSAGAGTILDVACGIVTAALAPAARAVVAFDLTPAMLDKARQRCARAGLTNVTFQEGSATALPFPDGAFDAAVTRLAIHHFVEPPLVLAEICRVLRPGGTLVVADVVTADDAKKAALQNAIEELRDPSHVRMLAAAELTAVVERAGFAITSETTWDKPRGFDEWAGIVADAERIAPLRTLVQALARAGADAGMGLALAGSEIVFFHRWRLIVGRKPSALDRTPSR